MALRAGPAERRRARRRDNDSDSFSFDSVKFGRSVMFKLCVFFLVAIACHAASGSGRVYDPAGGVVPGVQVTLTNVQSGTSASGTTTASGEYSFPSRLEERRVGKASTCRRE